MSRLLIVSNRLPVNISKKDNTFILQPSAGGLVTGLQSYLKNQKKDSSLNFKHLWVGWPGISPESKKEAAMLRQKLLKLKQSPVFLSEDDMENFYLSMSTLEGDPPRPAGYHIYVGSKAAWHEIRDDLVQYEEDVPG